MNLAENLQMLRKEKGLSQENLAERCQVSRQAIAKWESSESVPNIEKLCFLADFYDVYILATTQKFDKDIFVEAMKATAAHRGVTEQIADIPTILKNIEESIELCSMWNKYRKQFAYAEGIEYEDVLKEIRNLII